MTSLTKDMPIILFDNQCYLCMKFVKFVNFFARDKITIVGHYTDFGKKIRDQVLDETALDMFWFIDKDNAYGGRAALFPLLKSILFKDTKRSFVIDVNNDHNYDCNHNCKTAKAVFVRSSSLLTNSRKIKLSHK